MKSNMPLVVKEHVADHEQKKVLCDTYDNMGTMAVSKVPDYRKSMSCETESIQNSPSKCQRAQLRSVMQLAAR